MSVLLLDNYDSFTFNLEHLIRRITPERVLTLRPEKVPDILPADCRCMVLSPGPGRPKTAPVACRLIRQYGETLPFLGICLGMQCLCEVYGGKIARAPAPVHGKTDAIHHRGKGLFWGLDSPIAAARYHSLMCSEVPECFLIDAETDNGLPMAIRHKRHPLFGLQFHPESFMTPAGEALMACFFDSVDSFGEGL